MACPEVYPGRGPAGSPSSPAALPHSLQCHKLPRGPYALAPPPAPSISAALEEPSNWVLLHTFSYHTRPVTAIAWSLVDALPPLHPYPYPYPYPSLMQAE